MVASFAGVATGADGQWLLHSLVVVIIGGLGSIKGAVAGSLLYGMVTAFAPVYLPSDYTYYSIIFSFALLGDRAGGASVRSVRKARFGMNDRCGSTDADRWSSASSSPCSSSCRSSALSSSSTSPSPVR